MRTLLTLLVMLHCVCCYLSTKSVVRRRLPTRYIRGRWLEPRGGAGTAGRAGLEGGRRMGAIAVRCCDGQIEELYGVARWVGMECRLANTVGGLGRAGASQEGGCLGLSRRHVHNNNDPMEEYCASHCHRKLL